MTPPATVGADGLRRRSVVTLLGDSFWPQCVAMILWQARLAGQTGRPDWQANAFKSFDHVSFHIVLIPSTSPWRFIINRTNIEELHQRCMRALGRLLSLKFQHCQSGLPAWPGRLACQPGLPTWPASLACQPGLPVWTASLDCQPGLLAWLASLACMVGQLGRPAWLVNLACQPGMPAWPANLAQAQCKSEQQPRECRTKTPSINCARSPA